MQLPRGSGLEALDRITRRSLQYYADLLKSDRFQQGKLFPPIPAINVQSIKLPSAEDIKRPVESLIKGLNDVVSQVTARPEKVDYNAVVYSFLPPGAKLLKPQYPKNSNEIQFSDLDGDGRSELVTSYRTNEGIRTLILKKDEVQWRKFAEISNPEFDTIHYRNSADVAGDGKKYLLLGFVSRLQNRALFAYSLSEAGARKIFSRNYNKLELQKFRTPSGITKSAIAFWDEEAEGIYNIDLVHWNGIDLEKVNQSRYLAGKVIPFYVDKLRQNPKDTISWYNLAKSFSKAGDIANASRAISLGLKHNPDDALKSRFDSLKNEL